MILDKLLKYEAYNHTFNAGDIVSIKEDIELMKIDKILLDNFENKNTLISSKWYLSKEKMNFLVDRTFRISSLISWHMGIPYYAIYIDEDETYITYDSPLNCDNKDLPIVYIGEFYLMIA